MIEFAARFSIEDKDSRDLQKVKVQKFKLESI
jgi:hypothetical protein